MTKNLLGKIEKNIWNYPKITAVLVGATLAYTFLSLIYNNPDLKIRERSREERIVKQQYNEAHQRVFGEGGLANYDEDPKVSAPEQMCLYNRLGIPYRLEVLPERSPTLDELNRYIDSHTTQTATEERQ
jgi:hypothetical protein